MRGRPYANGTCRCGHKYNHHGWFAPLYHWCSGEGFTTGAVPEALIGLIPGPAVCPCERYVRDRRKRVGERAA